MCTLKETAEISSYYSRGHTEVAAGLTPGNGLSGTPQKPVTVSFHTHTHKLIETGQPVPSFLPSSHGWSLQEDWKESAKVGLPGRESVHL